MQRLGLYLSPELFVGVGRLFEIVQSPVAPLAGLVGDDGGAGLDPADAVHSRQWPRVVGGSLRGPSVVSLIGRWSVRHLTTSPGDMFGVKRFCVGSSSRRMRRPSQYRMVRSSPITHTMCSTGRRGSLGFIIGSSGRGNADERWGSRAGRGPRRRRAGERFGPRAGPSRFGSWGRW